MSNMLTIGRLIVRLALWAGALASTQASAETAAWQCEVLPPEHRIQTTADVKLVFATTHPAADRNLYFHDRSWLSDESMAVFYSSRTGRDEPFGYVESTGHLVRLVPEAEPALTAITCSSRSNVIYGVQAGQVVAWQVAVEPGDPPVVRVHPRQIAPLPPHGSITTALSESADGRFVSIAFADPVHAETHHIVAIEIETGKTISVARVDYPVSHVQFSWNQPDLLMFARTYSGGDRNPADPGASPRCRMWLVDFSGRPPRPTHMQRPGELATHECWWTEDRFTFCGGHHVPDESHVKVFDLPSGKVNIIGAGSWWPQGSAEEITRRAWWHAAGSPDGRWVVADNFYGDIVLFDANTTEERLLAKDHRRRGSAMHCHPGWAPSSDRVVFASEQNGNPDLVIAHIPKTWR